jgi:hypothetical protein
MPVHRVRRRRRTRAHTHTRCAPQPRDLRPRFSEPSLSGNINRRWRDGSLELDLPTFLLSEMFNCNHFIVSQTNPHIVPLLNLKKSLSRRWANLLELELRHRCARARVCVCVCVCVCVRSGVVVCLMARAASQQLPSVGPTHVVTMKLCSNQPLPLVSNHTCARNARAAHRCAQLKWIMPDWFPTKWVSLFTQPWEGDITLVLPSHLWNVGKSIVNPTTSDILNATRQVRVGVRARAVVGSVLV